MAFAIAAGMLLFGVIPAQAQSSDPVVATCDGDCVDGSGLFVTITMLLVVVAMLASWFQQKPGGQEKRPFMKLLDRGDKNRERAA